MELFAKMAGPQQARTLQGMGDVASATCHCEAAQARWENDYELSAKLSVPDLEPI